MQIDYDNEAVRQFILYGVATIRPYIKYKSNTQLRKDIDRVMRILSVVDNCQGLSKYKALNYEQLKYDMTGMSSVRLGYRSKYRLLFTEFNDGIKINIIEVSEHYGDK